MAYAKNDASQITLEMKPIKYFDDVRRQTKARTTTGPHRSDGGYKYFANSGNTANSKF